MTIGRMKRLLENSSPVEEAVGGSQLMSASEAMGEYVKTVRDAIVNNLPKKLREKVEKGTTPSTIGTVTGSGVSKSDLEAEWDVIVDFSRDTLSIHVFYKDAQMDEADERRFVLDFNERPGNTFGALAKWFDR